MVKVLVAPGRKGWGYVRGRVGKTGLISSHEIHLATGRHRHVVTNGRRHIAVYTGGGKKPIVRRGKGTGP